MSNDCRPSGVMPLDVSRFPPSTFGDECAIEGHVTPADYEEGIRQMEADPWVDCAIVVGVVLGASLSAWARAGWALPW